MVPMKTASPPGGGPGVLDSGRGGAVRPWTSAARDRNETRRSPKLDSLAAGRAGAAGLPATQRKFRPIPVWGQVFTLANAGLKGMALRETSYPMLAHLMQTGLTVHMAIMDRDHAVLVEQIVPPPEVAALPGPASGWNCTAPPWVRRWPHLNPRSSGTGSSANGRCRATTKTPSAPVRSSWKSWRRLGSAVTLSMTRRSDLGKRCLAVPVFGAARELLAAISVSGPCAELRPENAAELVKLLAAAATQIHKALGGDGLKEMAGMNGNRPAGPATLEV